MPLAGSARRLELFLATAALALLIGAIVAAVAGGAPRLNAGGVQSEGDVELEQSRSGQPMFRISGMQPGDVGSATVTLANAGTADGTLAMKQLTIDETPGPNGGRLSDALLLRVEQIGGGVVYQGVFAGVGVRDFGRLDEGESRRYRFTIVFPDGGSPPTETTGDNAYESASLSTSHEWTLVRNLSDVLGEDESDGGRDAGDGGVADVLDENDSADGRSSLPFTGGLPGALLLTGLLVLAAGLAVRRGQARRHDG